MKIDQKFEQISVEIFEIQLLKNTPQKTNNWSFIPLLVDYIQVYLIAIDSVLPNV